MSENFGNLKYSLEIQRNGPGQYGREILDLGRDHPYGMGAFTDSFGELQRMWERHPDKLSYRSAGKRRGLPEAITVPITAKLRARMFLEDLGSEAAFALYARHVPTGNASNMLAYDRIDVLLDGGFDSVEYGDQVVALNEEEADVMGTFNVNAWPHTVILPTEGAAISHGLGTNPSTPNIVDGFLYDDGNEKVLYLITALDGQGTPAAHLLEGVINHDWTITWTAYAISSFTTGTVPSSVARIGNRVFVLATTGETLTYADKDDLSTWTDDATTFASAGPNALVTVNAADIFVPCDGGLIKRSQDGGLSWSTALAAAALTSDNLTCGAVRNANLAFFGGASGALVKFENGNFSLLSDPTGGDDIYTIALPDDRPDELALGTSGAEIWVSLDQGATFVQRHFPGEGAGSVNKLAYAGPYGVVLYIAQTNASSKTRLLRDISGGHGGNNEIETVFGYTTPANVQLNCLLPASVNRVYLAGNATGGANVTIAVTPQE